MTDVSPDEGSGLMRRVAAGDRQAAAALFRRHGDAVYRYLRGTGASASDAEDLTQEVFLRALAAAGSYRGRGSLAGWLLRIARSCALDEARRDRSRQRREREWAESAESSAGPAAEEKRALARILERLPPEDREVIVLSKFLDLPAARVAEILDTTPGAARVRLHRALGRLAGLYAEMNAP